MTLPPRRPWPPVDPRRPHRWLPRPRGQPSPLPGGGRLPATGGASPYPPTVRSTIAKVREREPDPVVRQPMTPFLVLKRDAGDRGARPTGMGDERFSFWYEDVGQPGVRCPVPQRGVTYRFHVTVTNYGTAPTLLGMVELHAGGSTQYPDSFELFAMMPFSCAAASAVTATVEAALPDQLVDRANNIMAKVFDAVQDPVTTAADLLSDRHIGVLLVNKV